MPSHIGVRRDHGELIIAAHWPIHAVFGNHEAVAGTRQMHHLHPIHHGFRSYYTVAKTHVLAS